MTGHGRSEPMPGKKPGSKTSKLKKVPSAKVALRRPELRKPAATSRKAVAATTVKAEGKLTKKPASTHEHPAAPAERRPERETPARALAPEPVHAPTHTSMTSRHRVVAEPEDSDEGDGSESSSLLAGPRNVQPYVAKRGEQYMSKAQLSHFQQILSSWKRDLMEEVDRTVTHMKDEAANFPDPNDRATQEEEFSLELRTRDRERKLIRKIDEALKRTEDGSYGYCLETGEEIGIKRLEARPVATLSIEAQERRERRERQYGDRDDRYR
jgi:DnaK suppressor protein